MQMWMHDGQDASLGMSSEVKVCDLAIIEVSSRTSILADESARLEIVPKVIEKGGTFLNYKQRHTMSQQQISAKKQQGQSVIAIG